MEKSLGNRDIELLQGFLIIPQPTSPQSQTPQRTSLASCHSGHHVLLSTVIISFSSQKHFRNLNQLAGVSRHKYQQASRAGIQLHKSPS